MKTNEMEKIHEKLNRAREKRQKEQKD